MHIQFLPHWIFLKGPFCEAARRCLTAGLALR